ncbi:MAG: serine/threonine-protein phosphatase [Deltaproteobacteria bacterium]|nr:serine/threonine-protein phosphatase [Deltaproteobacteria bacterium]
MEVKAAGLSDVGLQREGNEDAFSIQSSLGLYLVADGMGGHLAGEIASRVAVEIIVKSFRRWAVADTPEDELFGYPESSLSRVGNYVLSGIRLANRVIYEMAAQCEQYSGMGTTLGALLVKPGLVVAANVGDSRVYMVRDGLIERISRDHTVVSEHIEMGVMTKEEAAQSPLRHILTRNLGSSENVDAEIFEMVPSGNDRFILCTDGLTDLTDDEEILGLAKSEKNPETLCKNLVDLALSRGGHDNATVVSVFLEDNDHSVRQGLFTKAGTSVRRSLRFLAQSGKKLSSRMLDLDTCRPISYTPSQGKQTNHPV